MHGRTSAASVSTETDRAKREIEFLDKDAGGAAKWAVDYLHLRALLQERVRRTFEAGFDDRFHRVDFRIGNRPGGMAVADEANHAGAAQHSGTLIVIATDQADQDVTRDDKFTTRICCERQAQNRSLVTCWRRTNLNGRAHLPWQARLCCLSNLGDLDGQGFKVWDGAHALVCPSRPTDGVVQFRPLLRFILSLVKVADGAETMGIAITVLGKQDAGGAEMLFDALGTRGLALRRDRLAMIGRDSRICPSAAWRSAEPGRAGGG